MSTGTFELLPVNDIELDYQNPRIAKWVEMYGKEIPAEQVALALGAGSSRDGESGPSYVTLKQSIMTYGGVIHPIIVNKQQDGKLVVIEGNTRTQIYREFLDQEIEGNWSQIPAMVYEDLSLAEIDSIRLQAHLVGTREWDPYSKAKYLDHLRNKEHLTFSQIVDFCGGDRREISNYIAAFQDMENYYRPILESDQDFDHTRFSAFVELQKPKIAEALLRFRYNKSDFSKWVHEKKLYPLRTVRQLPMILKNERSREKFLQEGALEALKLLEVPTSEVALKEATLIALARELSKRIYAIKYSEIQRLRNDPQEYERENYIDARDALISLCDDIAPEE